MVRSRIPMNVKILAIQYYKNNNLSYEKVADIFKINEKTLRRWIIRYECNSLKTIKQEKKSYKIKEKHVKYALKILKKSPTLSI
jgi:transposase